jgi:hypothetical protein
VPGLRHITDLGHANRDEPDVIMTKIRDMRGVVTVGRAEAGTCGVGEGEEAARVGWRLPEE